MDRSPSNIELVPMTPSLCREYFTAFENDPAIYADMSAFSPYVYSEARADAYFQRQKEKKRIHFAVTENGVPVGEVLLKNIDPQKAECTLSIHLQNDSVKGRGTGTRAERLAVEYAFGTLGMNAVLADTLHKNTRSQHILGKLGFRSIGEDELFKYYELRREDAARLSQP